MVNNLKKTLKLVFVLVICQPILACVFDENRIIEKILAENEIKFHNLYNQEKFYEIYSEADNELKNKFTERQFVSYLEVVKNDVGNIESKPLVWIEDELRDGLKRIFVKRTTFSTFDLVSTKEAIYREKFEWKLIEDKAKLVSFTIEKICNKPCQLNL